LTLALAPSFRRSTAECRYKEDTVKKYRSSAEVDSLCEEAWALIVDSNYTLSYSEALKDIYLDPSRLGKWVRKHGKAPVLVQHEVESASGIWQTARVYVDKEVVTYLRLAKPQVAETHAQNRHRVNANHRAKVKALKKLYLKVKLERRATEGDEEEEDAASVVDSEATMEGLEEMEIPLVEVAEEEEEEAE
jgi:hypothetical protein